MLIETGPRVIGKGTCYRECARGNVLERIYWGNVLGEYVGATMLERMCQREYARGNVF